MTEKEISQISHVKTNKLLQHSQHSQQITGRSKPWMKDASEIASRRKGSDLDKWCILLDSLQLPGVNCANIAELKLGSPLGFFNANFPKGGYKDKS
jgi:hypothetical protein